MIEFKEIRERLRADWVEPFVTLCTLNVCLKSKLDNAIPSFQVSCLYLPQGGAVQ